jgi:hypothetical protein
MDVTNGYIMVGSWIPNLSGYLILVIDFLFQLLSQTPQRTSGFHGRTVKEPTVLYKVI